MRLEPGAIVGGSYRVVRPLGKGGMGAVYEAAGTGGKVAIKVLHAHLADSARSVARFEREAEAVGRIGSPHIARVLGTGELEDQSPYIVMELCEGETLRERIARRGAMAPGELVPIVLQLCDGLGAAHAAGVVHRDLKPDNVFLSRAGGGELVKILDFGISKLSEPSVEGITQTGDMLGTPYFMAPEQAKGQRDVDLRADIYSVGVMMYRALAGRYPFVGDSAAELFVSVLRDMPPPLESLVPVDPGLAALVARAMARERSARPASAAELSYLLRGWQTGNTSLPSSPDMPAPGYRAGHAPTPAPSGSALAATAAPTAVTAAPTAVTAVTPGSVVAMPPAAPAASGRSTMSRLVNFGCAGVLVMLGVFFSGCSYVSLTQLLGPTKKLDVAAVPLKPAANRAVAEGQCLLGEMLAINDTCFVPVVKVAGKTTDYSKVQVIVELECSEVRRRWRSYLDMGLPRGCRLAGRWTRVSGFIYEDRLRARYPGLGHAALIQPTNAVHAIMTGAAVAIALIFLVGGALFMARGARG